MFLCIIKYAQNSYPVKNFLIFTFLSVYHLSKYRETTLNERLLLFDIDQLLGIKWRHPINM